MVVGLVTVLAGSEPTYPGMLLKGDLTLYFFFLNVHIHKKHNNMSLGLAYLIAHTSELNCNVHIFMSGVCHHMLFLMFLTL